jgi:ABC-type dipeptide/oligopeptide/nickel transport system permease subunit
MECIVFVTDDEWDLLVRLFYSLPTLFLNIVVFAIIKVIVSIVVLLVVFVLVELPFILVF